MKRTVEVEIEKVEGSILLGHTLGSAELRNGKQLYAVGIGNTVAFVVEGVEYRANIGPLANEAWRMHEGVETPRENTQKLMFEAISGHLKQHPYDTSAIEMAVMTAIEETTGRHYYCDIHG